MVVDPRQPTLVLIDDDELIQAAWKMTASARGHVLACFSSVEDFLASAILKSTPIYIDYHFSDRLNGLDVASQLSGLGYKKLYITTGTARENISLTTAVREVISKDYPADEVSFLPPNLPGRALDKI